MSATSQRKPAFSVRIVVCDHYLTKPLPGIDVIYSEFRGSDIKQVPVFRIFGSAPDGQKVCLHIHGVFPYFYVPCPSSNPAPQFLYQLAASLDKALNIAMKQATSATQHVYKITLVKGLPFYGFHDKDHLYLKIFLYNPGLIKQSVDLCSNGAILGQPFQPHESHLNFTLQFFIDFNLFGMSNIDLQSVNFRKKTPSSQNSNDPLESPEVSFLKPESICYYEADCMASHIINRQRIGKGDGIENPGLEEVWNQEMQRRQQLNMSVASKSLSQGRLKAEETDSHYKFEQIFLLKMSNLLDKPVDIRDSPPEVYYPAESLEGSQLFNATDISMHLPQNLTGVSFNETLRQDLDETLTGDLNNTVVDESIVLNRSLSLHYSQVQLDNEDLDLLDVLKDMDEKPLEEDSVMGTPADAVGDDDRDGDSDDAEYSQIFNEDTILLEPLKSKDDVEDSSPNWNDSFWDDANIPQFDGTCDDDHVKKVRKRKMRPFKLGLSRPKSKKKVVIPQLSEESETRDDSIPDEINASRETIDSISNLHLKKSIKPEPKSLLETDDSSQMSTESIMDLVNKVSVKYENIKLEKSVTYDKHNEFEPVAGPSNAQINTISNCDMNDETLESSEETNDLGFISFYDASKIFDASLNENQDNVMASPKEPNAVKMQEEANHVNSQSTEDIKLYYSETVETLENNTQATPMKIMNSMILTPKFRPPTKSYIMKNLQKYNIPKVINQKPFYSDHKDGGDKVEIGTMLIKVQSKAAHEQKPLEKVLDITSIEEWRQLFFLQNNEVAEATKPETLKILLAGNRQCVLEPLKKPPTYKEVIKWRNERQKPEIEGKNKSIENSKITNNIDELENSQAIGLNDINNSISIETDDKVIKENKIDMNESLQVTMQQDGSFLCFGSEKPQSATPEAPMVEVNHLTIMVLEVHAAVRGDLKPDPLLDPIQAAFINVTNDIQTEHHLKSTTEIIVVDDMTPPKKFDRCVVDTKVTYVNSEMDIFQYIINLIKKHDPDIMCGYEIEMSSWGYVLERSQVLGLDLIMEISRITDKYRQKRRRGEENDFEGRIIGRVLFNVWRLLRHELALSSYSFENCMYEILKERVPKYTHTQLAEWWNDESRILRWVPVEYYMTRLSGTVRMLEKLDIINRTAELARLFGLQWWEVLTRGSQFRVESLMLRAARPLNLIALSPTVKQRAAMRAPECLPLIFEPESRFYADPVIVLDFQSLYPSMMIAYNYCFSTCIGRVQNISGDAAYEFGAWRLRVPKQKLESLVKGGNVHWSPVGVGFVSPAVRRGVLPALLRRILAARQAVKANMKLQTDGAVKKAMHSRQLGLKLIANVTYGYTAANFSGRMPCVEVGDSVVAKGRETLERAIRLVQANTQWNAKVVYGDTDSMFVQVPGGTRLEAFEIGQQIADCVTADNPSPVALKLEKVYQPCILQTKKRYVGFMYESADQKEPVYEAKGIETVRRDGCPAGVKLLQTSLCELFTSRDVSRVRRLAVATLARLAAGSLPPRELFFTREYRGAAGYRPGAAAPPAEIARRLTARDPRAGPRTGERVLWLVSAGAPGLPLLKLARTPEELKRDPSLRPHVTYYATRALLPPLHRCFSLLGVNVFKWWNELGYVREVQHNALTSGGIARYLWRERCALCGARATRSLCAGCSGRPQRAVAALCCQLNAATTHAAYCDKICASCCGHNDACQCENMECPLQWRRLTAQQKLTQVQDIIRQMPVELKCIEF